MPHYKLTYFNSRGLCEMSRMVCAIGKIPYEDVRIPREEWLKKKKTFPFEQVPVLEVDGVEIPQSLAICRFFARKAGLAGKTDVEEALVDALADQFKDFFSEARAYYLAALEIFPESPEKIAELYKNFVPAKERYFRFITSYLKKSKTGFLAGGDLSYADLINVESIISYRRVLPDYTKEFPEIETFVEKVTSIPEIKEYLKNRPVTLF